MSAQLLLSTGNFEPAITCYQTLLGRKPVTALEDYAVFSFEGFRLELESASRVRDWFEALAQGASGANSSSDAVTDRLEREWSAREQRRYPRGFS